MGVTFSQTLGGGQTWRGEDADALGVRLQCRSRLRASLHEPIRDPNDARKGTTSEMIAFNWFGQGWVIPGANTAFLVSLIAATVLTLAVIPYGKRRPRGTPFSWGEAMLGATYSFGVMFLAFGVVPHQWIDHADKDLGWNRTYIIYGPGGILKPQSAGGWNPITLQYQAVRDIVVVLIHVYFFGLLIFIWNWWQKRGAEASTEIETSTYGRPLVKKA
jgi:hypothetical protein